MFVAAEAHQARERNARVMIQGDRLLQNLSLRVGAIKLYGYFNLGVSLMTRHKYENDGRIELTHDSPVRHPH